MIFRWCFLFAALLGFNILGHAQSNSGHAPEQLMIAGGAANKCIKIVKDGAGQEFMTNACEKPIIARYCYADGAWTSGDLNKTCNNEGVRSTGLMRPGGSVAVMEGVVVPRNSTRSSFLIFSACLDANESTRCWSDSWEESGFDLSPSGRIVGNKKYTPPKKMNIQSVDGLKCLNFMALNGFYNIKYVGECGKNGVVVPPVAMYMENKSEGKLIRHFIVFVHEELYIGWTLEVGQKELVLPEKTPTWIANILLAQGSKASLKRPEVQKTIDMAHASFKQREKSENWSQKSTDDTAQKLIDSSFPLTAATTLPLKTAQLSEKSSAETPLTDTSKVVNDEQGPVDPGNLGIEFSYKVVDDYITLIYGRGGVCSHLGYNIVEARTDSINERDRERGDGISVVKMVGGAGYSFSLRANADYSGVIRYAQKWVTESRGLPSKKNAQDNFDIAKCVSSSHQQYVQAVYDFHEKNWKKCPGACSPSKLRAQRSPYPFSN